MALQHGPESRDVWCELAVDPDGRVVLTRSAGCTTVDARTYVTS